MYPTLKVEASRITYIAEAEWVLSDNLKEQVDFNQELHSLSGKVKRQETMIERLFKEMSHLKDKK